MEKNSDSQNAICVGGNLRKDITFPPQGYRPTVLNTLLASALDLTAPASDICLKGRKTEWIQLSGHDGCFSPAGLSSIWKRLLHSDDREAISYKRFMQNELRCFVPKFYQEVYFQDYYFIEIEDLLQNFEEPSIMDIKMGTRTFLESEVSNQSKRSDLYQKMMLVDSNAATEDEKCCRATTKLRYMLLREKNSTSKLLGFRIDGIKLRNCVLADNLKKIQTAIEAEEMMRNFFIQCSSSGVEELIMRLKSLRETLEKSQCFGSHQVIGSSILIIYGKDSSAGAWMIDFAKVIPSTRKLDHRSAWQVGNQEDGYLTGVDSLIACIQSVLSSRQSEEVA